jgi:thiamine kinase-like enzyme
MTDLEMMRQRYDQEAKDHKVTCAGQVPPTYEAITPEWLTDVLCRKVPGAVVTSHSLDVRDDGSSNRRRIFIEYNQAGQDANLPATVFCKASEQFLNRLMLGVSGVAKCEADFYNLVRPRLMIEAPLGIYARFDPENYASLIMMEDMRDSVRFGHHTIEVTRAMAESMVETLADLHGPYYEDPALGSPVLPFRTWDRWWFDLQDAAPLYADSCDRGFADSEHLMSPALYRRRAEIWPATTRSVERHRELPKTLTHNDVHFKNWYITHEGQRMGLSDWQIACVGHWSRDLIYALSTALTIEHRRAWLDDLVRLYVEKMAAHGVAMPPRDEVWLNLRQQSLSALAFWTNTLRPPEGMPEMQPLDITEEFLRRLYAMMEDYDALDAFG